MAHFLKKQKKTMPTKRRLQKYLFFVAGTHAGIKFARHCNDHGSTTRIKYLSNRQL